MPAKTSTVPSAANAESLPDFVLSHLRSLIRARHLRPGDRIRETDVAQRLKVSRTPVREALKQLEASGLVESAPPRGFIVVELTPRRVSELYAMREVLHGAAARFAAEQAAPFEIENMMQLLLRFGKASNVDEAAFINRQLGAVIVSAAHNEYLSKVLGALDGVIDLLGESTFTVPGRMKVSIAQSRRTVDAIARRDPVAAEAAARKNAAHGAKIRSQMLFGEKSGSGLAP